MRRNVLIVRHDRLGDAVLATPLPREIKRAWPDARVGVLVRGYTRDIFAHDPHVDVVLTDDFTPATRGPAFWSRVRELRRHRFTHGLMLLADQRIAYMLAAAGIPVRVGHGITLYHALSLTRPVLTRKRRPGRHEGDYALDLLRAIGIEPADTQPRIHLTDGERRTAAWRRREWDADGRRIVGLHTTSGRSSANWEPAAWAELAALLVADPGLRVVVTDDAPPPAVAAVPGVVLPNRRAPLRAALVNLAALDLLVSASTGPMHAAAALGVPTLSLFCPLPACEPALWGARGPLAVAVTPSAGYCGARCPGDPKLCTFAGSERLSPAALARRVLAFPQP
ncbi:MAG: glycosyltransferase family 9 protein [Candidatus Krumholzibacteriia bacterium]